MKRDEALIHFYEEFETAFFNLFESFSCEVSFTDFDEEQLGKAFIAEIDAGSTEAEIRLFLRMPVTVLALTYPIEDITSVEEEKLEDWMAEICNMLMGKVKATLLAQGIDITLGIPESYYGVNFEDVVPSTYDHKTYYFSIDGAPVEYRIYIDLMVDELHISHDLEAPDSDIEDGELELF